MPVNIETAREEQAVSGDSPVDAPLQGGFDVYWHSVYTYDLAE
jgi:hypothetical protein